MLGRANTRMKDFYDIWLLSRSLDFSGGELAPAIRATFDRRKTEIPASLPVALTAAFAGDPAKQQQWSSFIENVAVDPGTLVDVVHQRGCVGQRPQSRRQNGQSVDECRMPRACSTATGGGRVTLRHSPRRQRRVVS